MFETDGEKGNMKERCKRTLKNSETCLELWEEK